MSVCGLHTGLTLKHSPEVGLQYNGRSPHIFQRALLSFTEVTLNWNSCSHFSQSYTLKKKQQLQETWQQDDGTGIEKNPVRVTYVFCVREVKKKEEGSLGRAELPEPEHRGCPLKGPWKVG